MQDKSDKSQAGAYQREVSAGAVQKAGDRQLRTMKRRRGTGCIFRMKGSNILWIKYHQNGKPIRESSHTTKLKEAENLLNKRLHAIGSGNFTSPKLEKIRVPELAVDLVREYRINGRKSIDDLQARWNLHLKPFFELYKAVQVTSESVARYVDQRQQEGAENATINRELAALKRMFSLARQSTPPKISSNSVPYIPMLKENNTRTGFLESKQHDLLAAECAQFGLWLRAMFEVGYTYGWRHEEVLVLRVCQVNPSANTIRLEPGTTKNDDGREVTMTQPVRELLTECIHGKRSDDYVFTRENGEPVRDFRRAWQMACCAAGFGELLCSECKEPVTTDGRCCRCSRKWKRKDLKYVGLIFHDLRRTAARNLRNRGVAEGVIMQIGGWKTRSMFDRYAIVSQSDIAEAMRKLEAGQQRDNAKTVLEQTQQFGLSLGIVATETEDSPISIPPLSPVLN